MHVSFLSLIVALTSLLQIPLDPHERCAACGHPYFNHQSLVSGPSTTDPACQGGCAHTLCGGFIPVRFHLSSAMLTLLISMLTAAISGRHLVASLTLHLH